MKIRIIFIILPIIIGVIASATGFSLVWRLFILSILVPLISYLWSYLSIRDIRSEIRSLPENSQVGDILESRLRLINVNKIPKLLLGIRENTNLPGYSNVTAVNIPSHGSHAIESKVRCTQRGHYTLGSFTISASDPLGLFPRTRNIGEPQKILVYPNSVDLPFFDPLTYINLGYGSGRWLESQISPNVSSIREYSSGDSLKHIHWQTTAHSSKIMVKVFDPDRSHSSAKTVWVVLDMCKSAQAGSGNNSTEEYGITIATSILKKYVESGWPVGFMALAEKPYIFPLETGSHHLGQMTTALATMKALGQTSIEQVINGESPRFDLNTMLIIITPSWSERLVTPLVQVKGQQGVVVTILLDPGSFMEPKSTSVVPRSLVLNGVQTYVVRSGDNLATVLDSRNLVTHAVH
jgi:uncharacterized protein (DUF58 family)